MPDDQTPVTALLTHTAASTALLEPVSDYHTSVELRMSPFTLWCVAHVLHGAYSMSENRMGYVCTVCVEPKMYR